MRDKSETTGSDPEYVRECLGNLDDKVNAGSYRQVTNHRCRGQLVEANFLVLCEEIVPPDKFIRRKPWLSYLLFRWDRFGIYPNAPQHLIHRVSLVRVGVGVCDRLKKCQVVMVPNGLPETWNRRYRLHKVKIPENTIVTRKTKNRHLRATICQYLGDRQRRHEGITKTSCAVKKRYRIALLKCPNVKVTDSRFGIAHATELPVDLWVSLKAPDLIVKEGPRLPGFVNTPY